MEKPEKSSEQATIERGSAQNLASYYESHPRGSLENIFAFSRVVNGLNAHSQVFPVPNSGITGEEVAELFNSPELS